MSEDLVSLNIKHLVFCYDFGVNLFVHLNAQKLFSILDHFLCINYTFRTVETSLVCLYLLARKYNNHGSKICTVGAV